MRGPLGVLGEDGAPEIAYFCDVVLADEDVVGFKVPVDYFFVVCMCKSIHNIFAQLYFLLIRDVIFLEEIGEAASWAVLHDDEVVFIVDNVAIYKFGDVVVGEDFDVIDLSDDLPYLLGCFGVELLDRKFLSLLGGNFAYGTVGPLTQPLTILEVVALVELGFGEFGVVFLEGVEIEVVKEHRT